MLVMRVLEFVWYVGGDVLPPARFGFALDSLLFLSFTSSRFLYPCCLLHGSAVHSFQPRLASTY